MKISELYDSYFDMSKMLKPYSSSEEHLGELFSFLDLCFTAAANARGLSAEGLPEKARPALLWE